MSDLRAEREVAERLRMSAAKPDLSLQDAYVETRAALAEVRHLYFQRASAEAAEFVRLEAIERRMEALEAVQHRVEALQSRMGSLEAQVHQVNVALSQKRGLYKRIVWLLFGRR